MRPKHDFEQAIYLAYGVTTTLDPSMYSQNMFPTAELIETGDSEDDDERLAESVDGDGAELSPEEAALHIVTEP